MTATVLTRVAVPAAIAIAYGGLIRPRLLRLGASAGERAVAYPGDDVIPGGRRGSIIATTLPAPPAEVWPWLVQMGADKAGFYSFDRLDNGGRASADRVHPEWQALQEGDRILSVPDGSRWFDVALLRAERDLVLRAPLSVPGARNLDLAGPLPRAFSDSTWGLHLRPAADGGTRLIVTGTARGRPSWLIRLGDRLLWEPAHVAMQLRQFAGLRRRLGRARPR